MNVHIIKKNETTKFINKDIKQDNKLIIYLKVKRIIDLVFALLLLIIFCIPMLIVSIFIKLEDGGPIIYKSKRVGKDLKEFYVYKFRSMKTEREELKSDLSHNEMTTKVGKFIRKTSLDELPQLINIIKGEMSFIGPRPWLPEYYEAFTDEQKRRASVLPGLSGLAQVKGRNGITIFEKIEYDIEYIDNMSFKQDIRLIIESIKVALKKANAEITEDGIKKEIKELKDSRQVIATEKFEKVHSNNIL